MAVESVEVGTHTLLTMTPPFVAVVAGWVISRNPWTRCRIFYRTLGFETYLTFNHLEELLLAKMDNVSQKKHGGDTSSLTDRVSSMTHALQSERGRAKMFPRAGVNIWQISMQRAVLVPFPKYQTLFVRELWAHLNMCAG